MSIAYNGTSTANSIPDITGLTTYTVLIRVRQDSTPGANDSFFAADNYPSTPREGIVFKWFTGPVTRFECYVDDTGGVSDTTRPSVGAWSTAGMTRSGTTATPYLNGSSITAITVGSGTADFNNIRFGCHYYSSTNNEFSASSIADFGIWDVVLTADEIAAYDNGVSAKSIRPQSLLRYIEGTRNKQEIITSATVSDIGTPTITSNPRIIFPKAFQVAPFLTVAAAGFQVAWAKNSNQIIGMSP